jgi:AcrR family transcriptional regulator
MDYLSGSCESACAARLGRRPCRKEFAVPKKSATKPVRPPPPRRKRRTADEITDRILRAAGEEFEQSGFSGATTANIARRADVTEAQLFRLFSSKADLFREAIFEPLNRHFCAFHGRYLADADRAEHVRDRADHYITELQAFIAEHSRMLMSLVVAQTYSPESVKGVSEIDSLKAYFERGAAMMTSRLGNDARVDPKLMVRVSFAAVLGCVLFRDWIFPPGLASEEDIRAAIVDFVIDGISATSDMGHTAPR